VEDHFKQTLEHLLGRISGPMGFRIIIQPLVSFVIGLRAGVNDAHCGLPPFGWSVLSGRTHRRALLKQAWRDIARVFIASIVIDLAYQIFVLRWIYPLQAVFVATVLALLPYMLVRGPISRVINMRQSRWKSAQAQVKRHKHRSSTSN
jgi:hypothetical protein